MTARLALVLALAAGCAGESRPALHVEGEPQLSVKEGEAFAAAIRQSPAATSRASATLRLSTPTLAPATVASLFSELAISDDAGTPMLRGRAACTAVHPGEGDALVPVTIEDPSGKVESVTVLVAIADRHDGACVPAVDAWVSATDCAAPPAVPSAAVTIEPRLGATLLCVHLRSPDVAAEPMTVTAATDLPSSVLPSSELPKASAPFGEATFAVHLADTTTVRGPFSLTHTLTTASGTYEAVVSLLVRAAEPPGPQLAIELRQTPAEVAEFDVGAIVARVWRDPAPAADDTCLRARVLPSSLPRAKPGVRYYDTATGAANLQTKDRDWLCGREFLVNVSPAIDAPIDLPVLLEASRCDCAMRTVVDGAAVTSRMLTVQTRSLAEELDCAALASVSAPSAMACADLDGNGTLQAIAINGGTACTWHAAANRFDATPLGGGVPSEVLALIVGAPARTAIFGRFASAPHIRALATTQDGLAWQTDLGAGVAIAADRDIPIARAVTLAPSTAGGGVGATHLVYGTGAKLEAAALVSGGVAPPPLALPSAQPILAVVHGDLGGEKGDEIVVFQRDAAGQHLLTTVVEMSWPTPLAPTWGAAHSAPELALADVATVSGAAALGGACATPSRPCDSVFVVVTTGDGTATMWTLQPADDWAALAAPVPETTPSTPASVAGASAHLYTGLRFGLWELTHVVGNNVSWHARDPYLIEQSGEGALLQPDPAYGQALVPCLGGAGVEPSALFSVAPGELRWTTLTDLSIATP